MKTTKTTVILLALVLLTAAAAKPAEAMVEPKISNTRTASCLVKITSDPAVLPLSDIIIDYLLHSSGVAGKAAREILDISPDDAFQLFTIEDVAKYSAGGIGIPPGAAFPGAAVRARTSPTAVRTPRPAATSTSRPGSTPPRPTTRTRPKPRTPTTPSRRPTTRRTTPAASPTSAAEQTYLLKLQVELGDEDEPIKPAAEEFMMALIENLRSALREAFDQYSAKLNQQLNLADKEAIQAEQQLVLMQLELRDISGSRDLSRHAILSDIRSVRQKLQSAKMKRASDETIYEATTRQIAEEQARRKKLVEDDPITREFLSILDVHKKRLENIQVRYKSGEVSIADVEDVKEKIIRARIELAQRQEEVSKPRGGIVLSNLNDELANLSTKMALAEQEIRSLNEQLEDEEDLLKNADSYELLSLKMDIARQNLEETLLWHARLGRNNRSIQPPDVTVIGAE